MTAIPHRAIADELAAARAERRSVVVPPSERFPGFTTHDAHEVARHHRDSASRSGEVTGGLKIGLTYEPTWERVGATEPFGSPMPAAGISTGTIVRAGELAAGRLEPEVVVWLATPIYPGARLEDVRAAVGSVALGFEIVDSHYPGWKATPPDLVADFGCHAGLRHGNTVDASQLDLASLGGLEACLSLGGREQHEGRAVDVLGGPLEAIVRVQRSESATRLPAGSAITTGSLTGRSHPIEAGQTWSLDVVHGPALPSITLEVR